MSNECFISPFVSRICENGVHGCNQIHPIPKSGFMGYTFPGSMGELPLPQTMISTVAQYVAPQTPKPDLINHPPHYTYGGIETIDVIEAWNLNYHLGNALKYISRADHKGSKLSDLRKARWYLDREISRLEKETE